MEKDKMREVTEEQAQQIIGERICPDCGGKLYENVSVCQECGADFTSISWKSNDPPFLKQSW